MNIFLKRKRIFESVWVHMLLIYSSKANECVSKTIIYSVKNSLQRF